MYRHRAIRYEGVGALIFLVAALLLANATPVLEEPAPDYRPPIPRATPSAEPSGGGSSLSIYGQVSGQYAANTSGGFALADAFATSILFGANYAFAHKRADEAGTFHFMFTDAFGSSLSQNALGSITIVQGSYGGGETPRLTALSYEQDAGKFDIQAGRVPMQSSVFSGYEYWQCNVLCFYQNGTISNATPTNDGFSYFPLSTWGASARFAPSQSFYASTGAYQATPMSQANRYQGFNLSFASATGVDFPVEFGFLDHNAKGDYTGSVRLGGYYDTSNALGAESQLAAFVPPDNPALGQIPTTLYRGQSGAWIYLDRLVGGSSAPKKPGVMVWGTYNYANPQTAQFVNQAQAGFIVHGTFHSRPNDTIALSWSYLDVNPRLRTFEYELQRKGYAVPINGVEQGLELNYGFDVGDWGFFRPAIQYIVNPAGTTGGYVYQGGAAGIHNALVLGFNATYLF